MVHRATFYSHFSDKYELLTYSIDEHIPLDKLEFSAHGTDGAVNPEKVVGDIINYVASNKDIYASILKKNNDYSIPDRIQDLFEEKILKIVNRAVENGLKRFLLNRNFGKLLFRRLSKRCYQVAPGRYAPHCGRTYR